MAKASKGGPKRLGGGGAGQHGRLEADPAREDCTSRTQREVFFQNLLDTQTASSFVAFRWPIPKSGGDLCQEGLANCSVDKGR